MYVLHVAVLALVAATVCFDGGVFAITNAVRVKIGEFQFAVWIKKQADPRKVICGGTLVSSEYVLTLASCVDAGTVGDYVVVVGDRRRHKSGTGETEHTITDIVKFSDVTLIKLSPVADTDLKNIDTVTLHSEMNLLGNETCFLTSFGYRTPTKQSGMQLKVEINVLAAGQCAHRPTYTADETLCYSPKQNRKHKACVGDGGSAVICEVEGTFKQVAINTETSCTSELHSARVASDIISWVNSVIIVVDCNDVSGASGVYTLTSGQQVYCDMDTDEGNWLVFQRRQDGSVDFERFWSDYRDGFGSLEGEFWLGIEPLRRIVSNGDYELRIDLGDWDGIKKFAKYTSFSISDESDNYRLDVSGYSGDAGDAMEYHNGNMFSTRDADNDQSSYYFCAEKWRGGWWYKSCHRANLNGLYHVGGTNAALGTTVNWYQWHGFTYSLKTTEMKIRRK